MLSLFGQIKVKLLEADLPLVKLKPQRKLSCSTQTVLTRLNGTTRKWRVRAVRRDPDGSTWAELLDWEQHRDEIHRHLERDNERRRAERDQVCLSVRSPDLPNYRARTFDVSDTGLRLVTETPVEVGVQLRLELDDRALASSEPRATVSGVIVWSRRHCSDYHAGVALI